jgi:hypothetical protein
MRVNEVEAVAEGDGAGEADVLDGVLFVGDDPGRVGRDAAEETIAALRVVDEHGY